MLIVALSHHTSFDDSDDCGVGVDKFVETFPLTIFEQFLKGLHTDIY